MDTEGRVLRLDSVSKVVSSGMRTGWVTGPAPLINQVQLDLQASCMHSSGVSQVMLLAMLEHFGDEGWMNHVRKVQDFYREKRRAFLEMCDKHLTGLAEWHSPSAGMFVWFRLIGIEDSSKLISEKAKDEKVLLVPGEAFLPGQGVSNYVRASYSLATASEMEEGLRRLAALLRRERSSGPSS
eukprot:NODE_1262_length_1612_cov_31.721689_g1127_i0.p1 GENE.NODE_1262_length_1612_cov_31.721689_g1127_i0~~NODE_1262_length_1612_cov_31.721689_g1127_i0.p1  ORF type:complete len:183 (-),score=35.14 NODE_1262_length_1612_cov_31.721689_g1127_i0:102-650(-)